MFKNYLKITFRNLKKHKVFSFINVAGLSVGMACTILIFLWVRHELSYDRFHENADDIYRVLIGSQNADVYSTYGPGPLEVALKAEYPEVVNSTRLWRTLRICPLKYEDKLFFGAGCGVESSFFEIFTFPFVTGDLKNSLSDPNFIILTEEMAKKYFHDEDPVGQTMRFEWWNEWYDFIVSGVIKNVPLNSHITFDFLLPFSFVERSGWDLESWKVSAIQTYVLLRRDIQLDTMSEKISGTMKRHYPESKSTLHLQPLSRIHLHHFAGGGSIIYVYIFSTIGILILIIACINFMNLSTARAVNRAKEVGVRKVVGSSRLQLIKQFLSESVLLSFIALVLSLIIVRLLIPSVNDLLTTQLKLHHSGSIVSSLIVIAIVTGIISGSYPALFLSTYRPVKVLKGSLKSGSKGLLFRKFLVVSQFVISILLIIGATVAYRQLDYIRNKDLGFDKEHIIHLKLRGSFHDRYETIKQELLTNSHFLSLRDEIMPLLLVMAPWWYNSAYVRIKSENISDTIVFIKRKLREIVPDYPFEYSFLDEDIDDLYKTEQRVGTLVKYGTFLAVFIACLGLFGLASLSAEQRTKEIAIRKVLGASIMSVVHLLSKEFIKWVLIANVVAWPIAYFVTNEWLQNFAYHVNVNIWIFVLSAIVALFVALVTVSYQSIKAARTNPVDSLRYE